MEKKKMKFRDSLAKKILAGEKKWTWRLFDDKGLVVGDRVDLINWETKEKFAEAELTEVREKRLGELEADDFDDDHRYSSSDEMYAGFRKYYGDEVGPDSPLKIIKFKLL